MTERKKMPAPLSRFFRNHKIEASVLSLGIALLNFPFVFPAFRGDGPVDASLASNLGSFVGGYIGALFALISVVLLYSTLRHQRDSADTQGFENRYFQLVRLHRYNVSEMTLQKARGRKLFVLMMREFRYIHQLARKIAASRKLELAQIELLHVAYYVLFYGVGPNSSRMLRAALATYDVGFLDELESHLSSDSVKQAAAAQLSLGFVPFDGHQSRLGHYYRHLYQTVTYVDKQKIDVDKYAYVKMLRAQLSTHEQAMLLLNSLTPLGAPWRKHELILKYRLVRNLPRNFFDPDAELDVLQHLPAAYFEWSESNHLPR